MADRGANVDEVDLDLGVSDEDISHAFAGWALSGPMGAVLAGMAGQKNLMITYGRYFVNKAVKGDFGSKQQQIYESHIKAANAHLQKQVFRMGYDVIVMPTLATSHIAADHDYTTDKLSINGRAVHPLTGWILTPLFNLLNCYPVVNVPTGLSSISSWWPTCCTNSQNMLRITTKMVVFRIDNNSDVVSLRALSLA